MEVEKMKNVCVALIVLLLAGTSAMAASIRNSAHDLSGSGTFASPTGGTEYGSTDTDRLCVYCHTPHGGTTSAPLWNRTNNTMAGSTVYTSSTFDFTMVATSGDTPLCMGCHDGDITDELINLNGAASGVLTADAGNGKSLTIAGGAPALIGLDFTNYHPVGFTYVQATDQQGGLKAIGVKDGAMDDPADLLRGTNEMWCSSCHDVHDPGTDVAGKEPFLRMDNSASALCFVCHNK